MFKFDVLAQQWLLFVCLFVFLVKRVQLCIYYFFSKLVKKAEKKDTETMKSLNPFVLILILIHLSSSFSPKRKPDNFLISDTPSTFWRSNQGGLAARSGTEFTWSPQLRNSAAWDWVQIFLENKYGGECRHGRTMSFCSVFIFPADKYQERFLWTILMDLLDIRRRDVWTVHGWLHLSCFGISGSSFIFELREFSGDHLTPSLIFFHLQWY